MRSKQDGPTLTRRRHSKTGKVYAVAKIGGRQVSFGPWGPDAHARFARYLAEWEAGGGEHPPKPERMTIAALARAFEQHAEGYYRRADGTPTGEARNIRDALAFAVEAFGKLAADDFGPGKLADVRQRMVKAGLARTTINQRVHAIRRAFRWAAARELIPGGVVASLDQLEGLRRGRSEARETDPVTPVELADVEATAPHLSRQAAAMVWLQWWSGMRPGEVVQMRAKDIDRSGPVWIYQPERHKTEHHGRERHVDLGPRAQDVLRPFLSRIHQDPAAPLFRPDEAELERNAERRRARRSPMTPSQAKRQRKLAPCPAPRDRYDVHSYRRAIHRAVDAANADRVRDAVCEVVLPFVPPTLHDALRFAVRWIGSGRLLNRQGGAEPAVVRIEGVLRRFVADARRPEATGRALSAVETVGLVPRWSPNQLRHSAATRLRKEAGLEAARVVLGHAHAAITEIYAEIDHDRAREIMARLG